MKLLQDSWSEMLILDHMHHRMHNNLPDETQLPNGQVRKLFGIREHGKRSSLLAIETKVFLFWNRLCLSNIYIRLRKKTQLTVFFCMCRSLSFWALRCLEFRRWPRSFWRSRTTSNSSASTPLTTSAWNSSSYSMQVNVKKGTAGTMYMRWNVNRRLQIMQGYR